MAELVRLAQDHPDPILLKAADRAEVDLSSVLAIMDLALVRGDEVVLTTAPSPMADGVLDALTAVLARDG